VIFTLWGGGSKTGRGSKKKKGRQSPPGRGVKRRHYVDVRSFLSLERPGKRATASDVRKDRTSLIVKD